MKNYTDCKAPVIIVGMHRSGTSLLAKLLQDLGLFIGWEEDTHNEAIFFRDRNESLLNAYGGSWDSPNEVCNNILSSNLRPLIVDRLKRDVTNFENISYLGPYKRLRFKTLYDITFPWGWKDPRNGLLLPIWLDIFPNAKVINIIRNAVDVAASLSVREHKNIESKLKTPSFTLRNFLGALKRQKSKYFLGGAWLLYKEKLLREIGPSKYYDYGISPVIDIFSGIDLWEQYLRITSTNINNLNTPSLTIRYEDILENPRTELTRILDYCRIAQPNEEEFKQKIRIIKQTNMYKFKDKQDLVDIYNSIKDRELMKKYNYHQI